GRVEGVARWGWGGGGGGGGREFLGEPVEFARFDGRLGLGLSTRRGSKLGRRQWQWLAHADDVEVAGGSGERREQYAVAAFVAVDDVLRFDDHGCVELQALGLLRADEVDRRVQLAAIGTAPHDLIGGEGLLQVGPAG